MQSAPRPKVVLYSATSLDGRTTGFPVDLGLFYSMAQEHGEDCSLVGCDTLLAVLDEIPEDDGAKEPYATPSLDDRRSILVVPDSKGRLKSWHFWRQQPYWKDWVALCCHSTPQEHLHYLQHKGIKTIVAGHARVDYARALTIFHRDCDVSVVRVDSGGTLNGVLLRAGLVDEIHLLLHPVLLGGSDPLTFFRDPVDGPPDAIQLRFLGSRTLDHRLVMLSYAVDEA